MNIQVRGRRICQGKPPDSNANLTPVKRNKRGHKIEKVLSQIIKNI